MTIGLFLTDSCNFQCKHCFVDSTLKLHTPSDDVINKFYQIVKYNKPETICILGGEPLLFIEKVSEIVNEVKEFCQNIIIYSNGTFLMDEYKRKKIFELGVEVRISKTKFHKEFWNSEIQSLIDASPYWKVEGLGHDIPVFPRGRALRNGVYQNHKCMCSLVTGEYNKMYHSKRFLIMQDGSVNIWCPCLALELANVFIDEVITHDLLVNRECIFREYLQENNLLKKNMLFECNVVCNNYRVTKYGIYYGENLIRKF